MFELSERMKKIPPYLFAEIDAMKRRKISEGVKLIDLGIGDPDLPTPEHIVLAMQKAIEKVERQKYPSYEGMLEFREGVAEFYKRRKGVRLDPQREVITLIGSKEGIAHLPLAFVNEGDYVLVPDPGYPVYYASTVMAGGRAFHMPLKAENNFLPDLEAIPNEVVKKTKILFLNYPNNPTSAVAEGGFIKSAIDFCIDNKIILAHDYAYGEIGLDGYRPKSFLEFENAFEVTIEFNSLSKTYNMTGWRIGFACGNEEILKGLLKVKTNVDSGVFEAVQEAGITALRGEDRFIEENCKIYAERRNVLVEGLERLGFEVKKPKATFYVWCKVGGSSIDFVKRVIDVAGIVATPGIGFGSQGEGYVRFALTRSKEMILEAIKRLEKLF
ncbi:MAG: LL-diaminopimelate aminotransferase [Archaeoglobaceae archaeon]|nr:LL-diaminopimelate aminotransferase [Archaeoglobaceae archaeon]MDW8118611.1 LL-diaminopimelate aminotransferase [Archaeoglobaceae archaeon]